MFAVFIFVNIFVQGCQSEADYAAARDYSFKGSTFIISRQSFMWF